jgi:hypothetical protein
MKRQSVSKERVATKPKLSIPSVTQDCLDFITNRAKKVLEFKKTDGTDIKEIITSFEEKEALGISNHPLMKKLLLDFAETIIENCFTQDDEKECPRNKHKVSPFIDECLTDYVNDVRENQGYCCGCEFPIPSEDIGCTVSHYCMVCNECGKTDFTLGIKNHDAYKKMKCLVCAKRDKEFIEENLGKVVCDACKKDIEEERIAQEECENLYSQREREEIIDEDLIGTPERDELETDEKKAEDNEGQGKEIKEGEKSQEEEKSDEEKTKEF